LSVVSRSSPTASPYVVPYELADFLAGDPDSDFRRDRLLRRFPLPLALPLAGESSLKLFKRVNIDLVPYPYGLLVTSMR
jgi:hypothetical protein